MTNPVRKIHFLRSDAALNTESCLRRSASALNFNPNVFCNPLGDRNIHWPMGPMTDDVKNVIMVIARIDANSLYENLVPGAGSTATGLVTLLAVHSLQTCEIHKERIDESLNLFV